MLSWPDVIDLRTVGIMIIMTCVISSMVSIVIWRLNRPMAGLISWMLAAFGGTLSFLAWVSMPWLGREIAIPLNMTISTGSLMLILDGVLRFRGLIPAGRLRWMTPTAMLIEAVQVIVNLNQDWLRITLNDMLNSMILVAMIAALLHRARRDERTIHLMIAAGTAVMVCSYLFRIDAALAAPRGTFRAPGDPAHAYVFFISLLFILSWTFGMLLMVNLKVHRALADLADRDPLTGIGNRRLLDRLATRSLAHDRAGLVLIDLDGFKHINDSFGHDQGDRALTWIADTLRGLLRPGETPIRLGGDEFALFIDGTGDSSDLDGRVAELDADINGRISIGAGFPLPARVSIGAAAAPADGSTLDALIMAADRRMYADKHGFRPGTEARP
ncbi:GGDEF domain-containing protein [Tistrella mobilis KA081020-065]|uniref:GGDEF domain-containing protein n=2 Tax=Tistrella mobilis TaxID=171437 RepID=I3TJ18_TISMK|nr:GGDEF domain-containing protein [Tistrella mobilis KA081020-065]